MAAHNNKKTTAYATNLVVKPNPGVLFGLTGYNSSGSTQFIQVHDSADLPAEGAIPEIVFAVPTATPFSLTYPDTSGRRFKKGIVLCNSSTGPTKTIGSADCWFEAQYE